MNSKDSVSSTNNGTPVATRIIEQLGETEEEPRKTIYQIVKKLGVDEALHFIQKTLEVENTGGIMVADQSRRRTTGGVFFYLIKTEAPPEITKHIFHKKLPIKRAKPPKEQAVKASEVGTAATAIHLGRPHRRASRDYELRREER